ncbi:MAG: hypothetical protein PHO91_01220 [Patescibacteria group bacterium]|nr:hypothetical protein [Patescibacteria group bacterium]
MKTSYSIGFFVLILVVIFFIFSFFWSDEPAEQKILLQTLKCQSDKIDPSVYNLRGDTSLIGAFISFKTVPIDESLQERLEQNNIFLKESTWIFDYVMAEIPTDSLCALVGEVAVTRVFIPDLNQ